MIRGSGWVGLRWCQVFSGRVVVARTQRLLHTCNHWILSDPPPDTQSRPLRANGTQHRQDLTPRDPRGGSL